MSESAFQSEARTGEQGFLLVGVIVMAALVLIALSVAAPVLAKDLQRERELEAIHRGQQYTRAIRLYYKKFNAYPTSVKALDGGAPQERFLRQHYLDPFTGKDDWRLIGVGQAKTTVKGFFGEPLSGLTGAGGGLGSASAMQSGGPSLGTTGGAASGSGNPAAPGGTSGGGDQVGASGSGGPGSSSFGSSSFGQNGSGSGSGGAFGSGSTGPFVGIGIPKDGASIVTLNEQSDYSTWEFIYDPRIEQLYAKSSIFGGGIATSSGGLGSASSLNGTPGASGTNPTTSGTPPTGTPPAGTPNSNTPTPNPGSPPQ
jgi:type II secretory pathway pseudopilin PulG